MKTIGLAMLLIFGIVVTPRGVAAQESALGPSKCGWQCFCDDAGCTCRNGTPGSGGKSCGISHGGCTVAACDASAAMIYLEAADGSMLPVGREVPGLVNTVSVPKQMWRSDGAGRSTLRGCNDLVFARRLDPATAHLARAAGRELTI